MVYASNCVTAHGNVLMFILCGDESQNGIVGDGSVGTHGCASRSVFHEHFSGTHGRASLHGGPQICFLVMFIYFFFKFRVNIANPCPRYYSVEIDFAFIEFMSKDNRGNRLLGTMSGVVIL